MLLQLQQRDEPSLANELMILPIPGTTSIQHLEENINAAGIALSDDELAFLG